MTFTAATLPISTERLVLRAARPGDVGSLHEYLSQEDVCRYLPHDAQSPAQCAARVETWSACVDPQQDGEYLLLFVELEGRHVGHLLFRRGEELTEGEVGWVLHPDVVGRGLATEAARALVDAGFGDYGVRRVTAQLDVRNAASVRLCERLGMRRAGPLQQGWLKDGEWTDTAVFAISRDEWVQSPVERQVRRRNPAT